MFNVMDIWGSTVGAVVLRHRVGTVVVAAGGLAMTATKRCKAAKHMDPKP